MEPKPPGPDGTREWLLQLERRVSDLERERALAEKRRRRSFWYIATVVVLYALLFYKLTSDF